MNCYALPTKTVLRRPIEPGQYTSIAFGERCKKMGVRPSMGTVGDAYDNAMAESFFATLECELIDRRKWETKTEARLALFTYIEGWYNPRRRHSALGHTSPAAFEARNSEKMRRHAQRIDPDVSPENPYRSKLELRSLPRASSGARRSDEEVEIHRRADRLRAEAG
jgi:putative transposase